MTVAIDDIEVAHEKFGKSFSGRYDFDDTTIGHEYSVVVDAVGTAYDRSFTGSTEACEAPPTPTDASAAVRVLPPTCDVPARLVLEDAVNAVWSTPTAVEGPAEYSVVATANDGHLFSTGEDTETFTGELADKLDSVEDGCEAPPAPVPARPEPVETSTSVDTQNCDTEIVTTTTTTSVTGWAYDEESNTWLATPPVTTVTTSDRDATEEECPTPVVPATSDSGTTSVADVDERVSTGGGELASTGADSGWLLGVAGAFLAAGAALMLVRRTRRA